MFNQDIQTIQLIEQMLLFFPYQDVASVDNRGWSVVHHAAFHGYHGILQVTMCFVFKSFVMLIVLDIEEMGCQFGGR